MSKRWWRTIAPAGAACAVAAAMVAGAACSGDGIVQRSGSWPVLPWTIGRADAADAIEPEESGGADAGVEAGADGGVGALALPVESAPRAERGVAPPELIVPVRGVDPAELADNFGALRSGERRHEGIDIMAPRGSPVVSAASGWVLRLGWNDLGGRTVYVLDHSREYVFYYAHLSGYADGIETGRRVRQGEVIGYVGDTGNARGWPQLHFQIGRLRAGPRRHWEHEPINPYRLLVRSPR